MRDRLAPVPLLALLPALACAPTEDPSNLFTGTGIESADGIESTGGDGDGDGDSGEGDGDGDPGDGDGDGDGDSDGGVKLDTLPPDTGVDDGPSDENCDYVDLLFVIDNSVSMGGYQAALGLAFPQFADTLSAALPEGTNVHVGVTSTEMGYAGSGTTNITNGECTFTGDGMPSENFYITPDQQDTGKNGAQGRLFDPGGGQYYFSFDIGDAAQTEALKTWFSDAAAIGTGGSNIEMSTAPAGWAFDPANDATNAGFVRDEGAVLLVFFMQDEPDQTPSVIDGMSGGQAMLNKVAAAKQGCGGLECVIGGGFLLESPCNAQGNLPLDDFLEGMSEVPQVAQLPDDNLPPADAAAEMNALLADTLADVIAAKCDEIPPVG
ncbi:hypothetical protein ENSA5_12210 [Enhygromyxa salina]|uniref:Endo-1,4-beta-xylanase A n=1 Tax=Enhygromyxa salina TaxID=215803 RepID=A0A2S9YFN2_9BACT|nr:hypothetical protein [Enhygromyxa salina]PRQ03852.1 hypothetical protein ENSA5_12210 [Enhygromyxa salina]